MTEKMEDLLFGIGIILFILWIISVLGACSFILWRVALGNV